MARSNKSNTPNKGRAKAPAGETKRQKFERLGSMRVGKALKTISLIGNLSGSGYEYTEDDVRAIRDAIGKEVNVMLQRFAPRQPGVKVGPSFSFAKPNSGATPV